MSDDEPRIVGVSRRTYPRQLTDPDHVTRYAGWHPDGWSVVIVLVGGEIGDYAAYCGQGEPAWVARHGDKLAPEEARCHFPSLDVERYRWP